LANSIKNLRRKYQFDREPRFWSEHSRRCPDNRRPSVEIEIGFEVELEMPGRVRSTHP